MVCLPKPAGERSRYPSARSEAEIRALWERLNEVDTLTATATGAGSVLLPELALWLKLRLLTAQRGQEVAPAWSGPTSTCRSASGAAWHLDEKRPATHIHLESAPSS